MLTSDSMQHVVSQLSQRSGALAEILAGTECASCTSQDQYADSVGVTNEFDRLAQFRVHVRGKTVEPLGPVKCQHGNAPGDVEADLFESGRHVGFCPVSCRRYHALRAWLAGCL